MPIAASRIGSDQKRIVRIEKGPNPPETCRAEVYEPPKGRFQDLEVSGTGGIESDRNGVVYDAWRISGHFTAFDRSTGALATWKISDDNGVDSVEFTTIGANVADRDLATPN